MRRGCWAVAFMLVLVDCGSFVDLGPMAEPSEKRPAIGCIMPTLAQGSRVEGKILPRIVRVIGRYRDEDGGEILDDQGRTQWMTLVDGEQDTSKWVPMSGIKFFGCGSEAQSFIEIQNRQQ